MSRSKERQGDGRVRTCSLAMAKGMARGEGVRAAYKIVIHIRQAKAPGREDREDRLYNVSNGMRGGSPSRESWAYSNVFPLGQSSL